jgi:nickel-dependent lactate racemase
MLYYSRGSERENLTADDLKQGLYAALEKLGKRRKVLAVPPDITRLPSRAGELTRYAWQYYGRAMTDVLPALGTHAPMVEPEIARMFGEVPRDLFRVHDWRNGFVTLGEVPAEFIRRVSEGKLDWPWPAQVSKLIAEGGHDLILALGQVVPHEVIGMASYNKTVFVGTGGSEGINKSHFLGGVYGMELNYACDHFAKHLPIVYVLTVVGATQAGQVTRGLFIGEDIECFHRACELALKVNFTMLDEPLKKVVVYLDPGEFKSTWLGNKSIYRTRMAMADGGQLIVLAPGLKEFGEDKGIDALIRKYGYVGTDRVLQCVCDNADLRTSLSAAAHLIHGSTEGRFTVTYCPGHLTRQEIESVGFQYADLAQMMRKYDPKKLKNGFNTVAGEDIFYISNPGLGLWATRARFK